MLDRSAEDGDGRQALNMVGTPNIPVTRSRSIASNTAPVERLPQDEVPPLSRVGRQLMPSAAAWNSGATTSVTSSLVSSLSTRTLTQFQVRLPCVSMAPLGLPVLPDVYMIRQTSSSPTAS